LVVAVPGLLWLLLALPAGYLSDSDDPLYHAGTAALLCSATMALALYGSVRLARRDPRTAALVALGASGLRMFVVLALAVVLANLVPFFRNRAFWLWLVVFYFTTLALDVALLLRLRPSDPAKPSAHGSA
jgi:hypothetical protein